MIRSMIGRCCFAVPLLVIGLLWWRSYDVPPLRDWPDELDSWNWRTDEHVWYVTSLRGSIRAGRCEPIGAGRGVSPDAWYGWLRIDAKLGMFSFPEPALPSGPFSIRLPGPVILMRRPGTIGVVHGVSVPHWMLMLAIGGWPVTRRVLAWRKRMRRRRAGLCLACGYDLRGSLSAACSECGTPA